NTTTTTTTDKLPSYPESTYHLCRYVLGLAEGQSEILRDSALPHESNLDLLGGVDFRKGCYVGQELTIRTEHRGVVRKRILPAVLYSASSSDSASPPPPPTSLVVVAKEGEQGEDLAGK